VLFVYINKEKKNLIGLENICFSNSYKLLQFKSKQTELFLTYDLIKVTSKKIYQGYEIICYDFVIYINKTTVKFSSTSAYN